MGDQPAREWEEDNPFDRASIVILWPLIVKTRSPTPSKIHWMFISPPSCFLSPCFEFVFVLSAVLEWCSRKEPIRVPDTPFILKKQKGKKSLWAVSLSGRAERQWRIEADLFTIRVTRERVCVRQRWCQLLRLHDRQEKGLKTWTREGKMWNTATNRIRGNEKSRATIFSLVRGRRRVRAGPESVGTPRTSKKAPAVSLRSKSYLPLFLKLFASCYRTTCFAPRRRWVINTALNYYISPYSQKLVPPPHEPTWNPKASQENPITNSLIDLHCRAYTVDFHVKNRPLGDGACLLWKQVGSVTGV